MSKQNQATWFSYDKLEKDSLRTAIIEASSYAKGDLLDVGCGDKPYFSIFKRKVNSYIGLDLDKGDVKGSALKLPFPAMSFDTVLCTQVIEHVKDPQLMVNEINRILKKNGYAILTAPLFWCLHEEPNDFFRFTKYSLEMIFNNANFKIIYIKDRGNWSTTLGQMISLYLEPSFNKLYLKYPKRLLQAIIQYLFFLLSKAPLFIKTPQAPLGYIVVAKKL